MFRLLFSKNSGHDFPLQQTLLAFSAAILLTGILSCNSSSSSSQGQNDSARIKEFAHPSAPPGTDRGASAKFVSDGLYVYFLENSAANPQLKDLLDDGKHHEKVVLQLHLQKDGILSLTAWPGKMGNKEFQGGDKLELTRGSLATGVTLKDTEVYLGSTEIGPQRVDDLRKLAYTSKDHYIMFFPKITLIGTEKIPHLVYVVQTASDSSETAPKANLLLNAVKFADVISFDTNPSPPRPVDSN